jgi:hypothetical protein
MRRRDFPKALALTAAGTLSLSQPAAAAMLQCETLPSPTGSYPPGHLFRYLTEAQRTAFSNYDVTSALTTELQTWIDQSACAHVVAYLPSGEARIAAPLILPHGVTIRGEGGSSRITAWTTNCIEITGQRVTIEKVGLYGANKTQTGIYIKGTTGTNNAVHLFTARDVSMNGFLFAVNGEYMWDSLLDNVEIQNCNVGVRLFGLSVNNRISNCQIVCTGGLACIVTTKNPSTGERGEGLMVLNCLLASADSAFRSNGFLAVGFYNCCCDLLTGVGFDMQAVESFTFNGPWVYSTNACFKWADIGAPTEMGATITVGRAQTIGNDNLIHWGLNNVGLSIVGGQLIHKHGVGVPLALIGNQVSVMGTNIVTDAGRAAAYITGADVNLTGVTGNRTVM